MTLVERMAYLEIGSEDRIYYDETEPSRRRAPTFVFVNALLHDLSGWETAIAPALRASGSGVVLYDQRGQGRSSHSPRTPLTVDAMTEDLLALLDTLHLESCILVGELEGALIAARAALQGAEARGLVLLNGLRAPSPRADWAMETAPHLAAKGGASLLIDAWLPMLVGPAYLAKASAEPRAAYQSLDSRSGLANRLRAMAPADWSLPYERLTPPTLAIIGLQDRLFLDRAAAVETAGRLPRGRLEEWAEAGHFLTLERPLVLAERLQAFGAEIAPAQRPLGLVVSHRATKRALF